MMNWHSQLTQLIFDFYRENLNELHALQKLKYCRVSRRWGVLRVRCDNVATAQELAIVSDILLEPIAQLRLAKEVRIMVDRMIVTALPVEPPKLLR